MLTDSLKRTEASVAKFDAGRLRKLAGMMVTDTPELEEPEEILLDIGAQDPAQLLRDYRAKQARYVTAPFDPEGRRMRFYPGGYSIWSGFPGAGKSTLLRQSICQWLNGGQGVFVASLEEHPHDLLIRLAGTAYACEEPTEAQLRNFCDFYAQQLRIWGRVGIANHRKILGAIQSLSKETPNKFPPRVEQVVIDSLMKLDIDSEKWEGQRQFSNLLSAICQTCKVHVHMVAHPKKPASADADVHITDVGGSKDIVGGADNVLFIRRGGENEVFGEVCGMRVSIRKQRHYTGALGEITGWFNRRLRQFKQHQLDQTPVQYVP